MSEFLDKDGMVLLHQLFKEYIDSKMPDVTTEDNGKFLSVENGVPTWVTIVVNNYYTGSESPSSTIGNDGDLYLMVQEE